jgi:two-component system, cell cycle sensor histidine kinase and response regulator CckA
LAITENGNLIYKNHRFAQLMSSPSANGPTVVPTQASWQTLEFAFSGRKFSLTTVRTEEDLGESDWQHLAMVGRLVGGVAHDFNNLLTGILLYCDLLQSKAESAGVLWKKMDEIRTAAEQGAALIRQLMTVGHENPEEQSLICFNQVVCDLESLLRHLLGEQIRILMDLAGDSALVGITSAQAQQITLNLALNARDAMPTGGVLRFQSSFREFEGTGNGGRIFEFIVSDTGQGMDGQTAARAFDPFFSTQASGHGTGLATVRSIVEAAGGFVCTETSPGQGTRMIVRLPEVHRSTQKNQAIDLLGRSTREQSEDRGIA